MRIHNKFEIEIKPHEWLYIIAVIIILILIFRGNINGAIQLFEDLLRHK